MDSCSLGRSQRRSTSTPTCSIGRSPKHSTTATASLLVATIDDDVVGYILVSVHATLYANGPVVWIEELMVRDTDRHRGVGRNLVRAAERVGHGSRRRPRRPGDSSS